MKRLGFVGIGFMGRGIARNIVENNPSLHLWIHDVNGENIASFMNDLSSSQKQSVTVCEKLTVIGEKCNFIGLSLPSENSTKDVLFGSDGLVWGIQKNPTIPVTVLDHGTFSRDMILRNAKLAKSYGFDYADAPVSGGPDGAKNGTLTIMMGGSAQLVARCRPILDSYSSKVVHFGPIGSGMAAKLVNQALVGMHAQAASEAIQLAEDMGLSDMPQLLDMLQSSWGQSKILELALTDHINASKSDDPQASLASTKAPLRNMLKDFKCIEGNKSLINYPSLHIANDAIKEACAKGLENSAFVSLKSLLTK